MSREPTLGASAIRRQFAELAAAIETPTTVYLNTATPQRRRRVEPTQMEARSPE